MRRACGAAALMVVLASTGCGGPGPLGSPLSRTSPGSVATSATAAPSAGTTSSAGPSTATDGSSTRSGRATTPTTSKTRVSTAPPAGSTAPPAKPPAKGSPVRIDPIDIQGSPYGTTGPLIRAELADECGGTLCVTIRETVGGPASPQQDCTVNEIIQPSPLYRGDTVTFVLSDPCGDFTEPPPSS